jgi:hypothetical protein
MKSPGKGLEGNLKCDKTPKKTDIEELVSGQKF